MEVEITLSVQSIEKSTPVLHDNLAAVDFYYYLFQRDSFVVIIRRLMRY